LFFLIGLATFHKKALHLPSKPDKYDKLYKEITVEKITNLK